MNRNGNGRCQDDPCGTRVLRPVCPAVSIDPASIQQLVQALALGPPLFTQDVARTKPVYGSEPFVRYAIAVVAPNTLTGDASAILGAVALALAETNARGETVSNLVPATVSQTVSIFSETMPDNMGLRLERMGVRVHSQKFLRFYLLKNGTPLQLNNGQANSGAFEFSSYGDPSEPVAVFGEFDPNQTISLVAKNLDVNSGYLVEMLLQGYLFPRSMSGPAGHSAQERYIDANGLAR